MAYRGEVGSKNSACKAASAHIAKIPEALARHIGRAWKPLAEIPSHDDLQEAAVETVCDQCGRVTFNTGPIPCFNCR